MKDFATIADGKPKVLDLNPEVIELTKTILRQNEKIIMANIQLLERLGEKFVNSAEGTGGIDREQ